MFIPNSFIVLRSLSSHDITNERVNNHLPSAACELICRDALAARRHEIANQTIDK